MAPNLNGLRCLVEGEGNSGSGSSGPTTAIRAAAVQRLQSSNRSAAAAVHGRKAAGTSRVLSSGFCAKSVPGGPDAGAIDAERLNRYVMIYVYL